MKTAIAALTLAAMLPMAVQAGNITPPRVEPVVVVEEAASSSGAGLIVPLMLVAIIAAVASSSSGGTVTAASDARLKTDITQVGLSDGGLPIYQYRYIGTKTLFEGVMAQDVLALRPDAVVTHPSGYLMVDYAKLGLELRVVN